MYSTMDRRKLARAALYVEEQGIHLKSMSELLRLIVDIFDSWLDKKEAPAIESTHEAHEILQHMFRASLNAGNRRKKNLLNNFQTDEKLTFQEQFPKPRGRQPQWSSADADRMREAAERAANSPRMKELLKQLGNGE